MTVVGCGDPESSPEWYIVDVSIALENMVIAATAQGVGSCWIGDFDERAVKEATGIPERLRIVALISFGYPAEQPTARRRKAPEVVFHYDRF